MPTDSETFTPTRAWWKSACVYQIYPISFFDSNGDGFGDLPGILAKVDYLEDLGVDVMWMCPIYKSPLADMGYDVSDYESIDERFGTLEDWDRLAEAVHKRGMKLIMDLVANHTSDEHEWFKQSRSSKTNPKRNWYIWRPPRYDEHGNRKVPNNWRSSFQGTVWDFDETTGEYYLHLYASKQPDLNLENPAVREGIYKTMRFCLDRGCDGFRLDVINKISKVEGLPDAPITDPGEEYQLANMMFVNGPRVHEFVRDMNTNVISKYNIITVGETPATHEPGDVAAYVLPQNHELHMVFQFEHIALVRTPWTLPTFKSVVNKWQSYGREEGFWNTLFLENHDTPRSVSRFGHDAPEWRVRSATLLATLQTTLSGTLFVYQGEEIGMKNVPRSWCIEEYKDIAAKRRWDEELAKRRKETGEDDPDMSDVLDFFQTRARDHARTPMQWDATAHAGFTSGTPWMRVNDDYAAGWNVAAQADDSGIVLAFWRRALALRKAHDVLVHGDFTLLLPEHEQLFAYSRTLDGVSALVLLNFGTAEVSVALGDLPRISGAGLVLANYASRVVGESLVEDEVVLRGYEALVYIQ